MRRVCQDVGVRQGEMAGEVTCVKDIRKLGPTILPIGTKVLVQLVE